MATPVPGSDQPWPRVEGYQILRQLGAGGMGSVYAARRVGDPALCALKVLNKSLISREFAVRRFWKEVEVLMLQRHPGILGLRDAGHAADGRLYLATELIHGTDLFKLIHRAGPMPLPVWLELSGQLLEAISAAHSLRGPNGHPLRLVHRDMKPENIMVTFGGRVVVLDFGLAQARSDDDSRSRITKAGQVMGTPKYMAPEQIMNPDAVDQRTDVYSTAIVLYVSALGRTHGPDLPNGDDKMPLAQLWAQMMDPHWLPISSVAPQIPMPMDPVFARGLAIEMDERPDAATLGQMIREAAGSGACGPHRLGEFVSSQFRAERAAMDAWMAQFEGTPEEQMPTGYRPADATRVGPAREGSFEGTVATLGPTRVGPAPSDVPPTLPLPAAVRGGAQVMELRSAARPRVLSDEGSYAETLPGQRRAVVPAAQRTSDIVDRVPARISAAPLVVGILVGGGVTLVTAVGLMVLLVTFRPDVVARFVGPVTASAPEASTPSPSAAGSETVVPPEVTVSPQAPPSEPSREAPERAPSNETKPARRKTKPKGAVSDDTSQLPVRSEVETLKPEQQYETSDQATSAVMSERDAELKLRVQRALRENGDAAALNEVSAGVDLVSTSLRECIVRHRYALDAKSLLQECWGSTD